jgi:hypothetical protein
MVERPMRQQRLNGTSGKTEWMPSALCSLPALQDLAPVWRSLLAVTSDVTYTMII